ncbi:MAG: cellulose biosynthesis cyclic di-GMP-binding regulatory protein BcsB [Anaerolineae bacterium]|nr:cellulose biosynthesis cyclic di-GMP-binding regulatory protein BcsB [Anaerolineae bacterium]
MRQLRTIMLATSICFLLLAYISTPVNIVLAQIQPPETGNIQLTFEELGYEERVLSSPHSVTEYNFNIPQSWVIQEGSYVDLDFSYTYIETEIQEPRVFPPFFGDLTVTLDNRIQLSAQIRQANVEHEVVRIELPADLLNSRAQDVHSLQFTLDASYICEIPHKARLIIHAPTILSLNYENIPIEPDLSVYPRPFYQRAFEPDAVKFVLPVALDENTLNGAVAVAAKLGGLTYNMAISSTTDLEMLQQIDTESGLPDHLIVIGKPGENQLLTYLNQAGLMPVTYRERRLELSSTGPAIATPGDEVTYTLTVTNTESDPIELMTLVNQLPAQTEWLNCSPECEQLEANQIEWILGELKAGETAHYTFNVRVNNIITNTVVDNTATILDQQIASAQPVNVNTLTTTLQLTRATENSLYTSPANKTQYFFTYESQTVPENDGVIQEIVSPWNPTKAILMITGLTDAALYKASLAMSHDSYFPDMEGAFALVQSVRPVQDAPAASQATNLTFGDLGYKDRLLQSFSGEAVYYFDLPVGWQLTDKAKLTLKLSHSQLLDYDSSLLNIVLNDVPLATLALSQETANNREIEINLPADLTYPGQSNQLVIQAELHPYDDCAMNVWLLINQSSALYLEHELGDFNFLDLSFYPYPFTKESNLSDVLFVLPPEIETAEWESALHIAFALGAASGADGMAPKVTLQHDLTEEILSQRHLIVIGRPTRSPLLQQLNERLPQPFQPGTDTIEQQLNNVILRLSSDVSLGYLQLINSPWNNEKAILAVTGTTNKSVSEAATLLASQAWAARGNLTLVRETQVRTFDTRELTKGGRASIIESAIPELTQSITDTVTPTVNLTPTLTPTAAPWEESSVETVERPGWIIPLIVATGAAILIILAIAFWQIRHRRA